MPRQKPRKKGKPLKTEPGAIRFMNKNDTTDQPKINKPYEIE